MTIHCGRILLIGTISFFIQNRKPGLVGQVRDNRLCHWSNLNTAGKCTQPYHPSCVDQSRPLPPGCRPYPPACKPYGLEAGPEAGPGSLHQPSENRQTSNDAEIRARRRNIGRKPLLFPLRSPAVNSKNPIYKGSYLPVRLFIAVWHVFRSTLGNPENFFSLQGCLPDFLGIYPGLL